MIDIKPLWKKHPLYKQGKIEIIPTSWVWKYRGVDVLPSADLKDGSMVTLDKLWENICREGLYDPFIMRVGLKNKKFRLEAGNHRIQIFYKNNIAMIPVTVQVKEECGPEAKNVMTIGTHNFDSGDEFLISKITDEYMAPSKVFKSLSNFSIIKNKKIAP